MNETLDICLVNGSPRLASIWESGGHRVHHLHPAGPYFDIADHLAKQGLEPDLLVQVELLRERVLLSGLEKLSCRKLFWAIDVHLNSHWHGWYGRLFDLVLSSQKGWMDDLERAGAKAAWLPWYGPVREWVPHAGRGQGVLFVGRVTSHRPTRQWFARFLEKEYGTKPVKSRDFPHMLELYDDARMAPNESICGEINFRLFETAGCGCAVLTQPGPGLEELYEPGREILVYRDAVEFKVLLDRLSKRPQEAEALGRAAWERTRAEHLLVHRAGRILELARGAVPHAHTGKEARAAFGLAVAGLWESGSLAMPVHSLLEMLKRLPETPEVTAVRARFLAGEGWKDQLVPLLGRLAMAGDQPLDIGVASACSLSALHQGLFDLAKTFWYRLDRPGHDRLPEKPGTPVEFYRLWARELWKRGLRMRRGVVFDEARRVPVTAVECLLKALYLDSEDLETYRRLEAAVANVPGLEPTRLGFLSHLALHRPRDWRIHFELGMTNLQAFRLQEGLGDLMVSRDMAEKDNALKHFRLLLSGRDPSGRIAWAPSPQKGAAAPAD